MDQTLIRFIFDRCQFLILLGDLGKELKNLITLMDQEEKLQKQQESSKLNTKESPV